MAAILLFFCLLANQTQIHTNLSSSLQTLQGPHVNNLWYVPFPVQNSQVQHVTVKYNKVHQFTFRNFQHTHFRHDFSNLANTVNCQWKFRSDIIIVTSPILTLLQFGHFAQSIGVCVTMFQFTSFIIFICNSYFILFHRHSYHHDNSILVASLSFTTLSYCCVSLLTLKAVPVPITNRDSTKYRH